MAGNPMPAMFSFESLQVHSPRLAAFVIPAEAHARKRESRKQQWISSCQARGRLVALPSTGMTTSRTWGSDTPLLAAARRPLDNSLSSYYIHHCNDYNN
jgi:hypothetical protein